jgi:hypothetical protein
MPTIAAVNNQTARRLFGSLNTTTVALADERLALTANASTFGLDPLLKRVTTFISAEETGKRIFLLLLSAALGCRSCEIWFSGRFRVFYTDYLE